MWLSSIAMKRTHLTNSRKARIPAFALLWLALATLLPNATRAEIFKCVAADGALTFSQSPCRDEGSKVTVQKTVGAAADELADCEHARRFALATAQEMRSGTESRTVFDRYGGLGALSKGSVSLISYVFQFRTNSDVSVERISALATSKCQARAFGDVSCEQLPVSFTNRTSGCNDNEGPSDDVELAMASAVQLPAPLPEEQREPQRNAALQAQERQARVRDEEQRSQCKQNIKAQIGAINAQMRSGYSSSLGESLKKKRRALEDRLRDC